MIMFSALFCQDASSSPVTESVQSNAVTDASGNPVTSMFF